MSARASGNAGGTTEIFFALSLSVRLRAFCFEKERRYRMPSEFVFVPTPYGAELQDELAKALRARTEIIS